MGVEYLVRFDDICPTMNWSVWDQIEKKLIDNKISPLLAVVPDNKDEKLVFESAAFDFWDRVRRWQSYGWTIGVHGYQHEYTSQNKGILGLRAKSEFAGHSEMEQRKKINKALNIFNEENIRPAVWIAPSHTFDGTTLKALTAAGLKVISDGYYLYPCMNTDMLWIPQQLWRFRRMPFGLWTVCFHHNKWRSKDLVDFEENIKLYKSSIRSFSEAIEKYKNRKKNFFDGFFSIVFSILLKCKMNCRLS